MKVPSYYLAPISYYARLVRCPSAEIDRDEPYQKQTLRNRCWIASPQGPLALTVPVVKFAPYRTPMRDIRISDHGNWRHVHWNALTSSYHRTPFFEFLADDFAPFYERRWEFLADYNQALQDVVCRLLDIEGVDGRGGTPSLYGAQREAGDDLGSGCDTPRPYYQLFSDRNGFMPDLSIVDLLFNLGPEALLYLMGNPR